MLHRLVCHSPLHVSPDLPLRFAVLLVCGLLAAVPSRADDMAAMQKRLNDENTQSTFATQDIASIEKYVEASLQQGLKPNTTAPKGWRPGSSCDSYYGRPSRYNYNGYRDCLYHYRYYGRYW